MELLKACKIDFKTLSAISVSNGPGSYTGLRIGLSTAKGLCYGLKIPLIPIDTLQIIAYAASKTCRAKTYLVCQDAGRQEIYFGIYNAEFETLFKPTAIDLNQEIPVLTNLVDPLCICGNGIKKTLDFIKTEKYKPILSDVQAHAKDMVNLAEKLFQNKLLPNDFSELEPYYLKPYFFKTKLN